MRRSRSAPPSTAESDKRHCRAWYVVRPGGACAVVLCSWEAAFRSVMPAETSPEFERAPLAGALLQLKALGIDRILHFDFPSPPPAELLLCVRPRRRRVGEPISANRPNRIDRIDRIDRVDRIDRID